MATAHVLLEPETETLGEPVVHEEDTLPVAEETPSRPGWFVGACLLALAFVIVYGVFFATGDAEQRVGDHQMMPAPGVTVRDEAKPVPERVPAVPDTEVTDKAVTREPTVIFATTPAPRKPTVAEMRLPDVAPLPEEDIAVTAPREPPGRMAVAGSPVQAVAVTSKPPVVQLEKIALMEARDLIFSGQRARAKGRLSEFEYRHPGREKIRVVLAGWLIEDGDWHAVLKLLAGIGGDSSEHLRMLKARALVSTGESDAAVSLLGQNPPAVAEAPQYHALLAAAQQQAGDHAGATETYGLLLGENRFRGDWWMGLAISRDRLGDSGGALTAYRQAVGQRNVADPLRRYAAKRIESLATDPATEGRAGQRALAIVSSPEG